jgi:hypothetical protein
MLKFFFKKTGRLFIFRFFFFFFLFTQISHAQTKSNLEVVYQLVDSSVSHIISKYELKQINLKLILPDDYEFLSNHLHFAFINNNVEITESGNASTLSFSIDEIRTRYNKIFRTGFFGSFLIEREVYLKGKYLLKDEVEKITGDTIYAVSVDSVRLNEINEIQNPSLSFTEAELPEEPFFSSIVEPVIAIATAAAAIALFFIVRSK